MEWRDEGVILSVRPHGETSAIADLFTRAHGRHAGLVRGGRSRRMRPILQTGNLVEAVWKGRLAEHLGSYRVELVHAHAALAMTEPATLAAIETLAAFARLLPERDPHPNLYEVTLFVLRYLGEPAIWPSLLVRWELVLLEELGYGLDLAACAATGARENLVYVSPKSGRAVSGAAGAPYRDRLLGLPAFLGSNAAADIAPEDIAAGFTLTGHFLECRVLAPRGLALPEARSRLLGYLG